MTKSNRPMVRIHNTETNEIIDREMNDAEFVQYEADNTAAAAQAAEAAAKAIEKDALLARLGISADEAKLLLS